MARFYEITPEEAALISAFITSDGNGIDPFCGLQTNGNYIIAEDDIIEYSEDPNILRVDFVNKIPKEESDLDFAIDED